MSLRPGLDPANENVRRKVARQVHLGPAAGKSVIWPTNAVQFKVVIDGIEPAVWRRLVVPADWHLGHLHLAIQAAFNWWNYHLHMFEIGGLGFSDDVYRDSGEAGLGDARALHEAAILLSDFRQSGCQFSYTYDFGDMWRHTIEVEEFLFMEPRPRQAICLEGQRACPPEDVGGVNGYSEFLRIMLDPAHPEYRWTKKWCGGHFDPSWFDLAVVNRDLRRALIPDVKRRQYQPKPKRSTRPGADSGA